MIHSGNGIGLHSNSLYNNITLNIKLGNQNELRPKETMAESDEVYVNGNSKDNSDNDDTKISDQSVDITHENPFVKFLRGFTDVPEESVRKMRYSDLLQRDFSALSDDDLKLFGLENELLRREMLVKFSNTPNQLLHYDKYLENMDADQYRERAYKNVQDQLHQMNMVLQVTQNVLRANPIHRDRLATDSVYVSSLNKKAMEEMFKTIARLTHSTETKQWNLWLYSFTALGILGSLAILRKVITL